MSKVKLPNFTAGSSLVRANRHFSGSPKKIEKGQTIIPQMVWICTYFPDIDSPVLEGVKRVCFRVL